MEAETKADRAIETATDIEIDPDLEKLLTGLQLKEAVETTNNYVAGLRREMLARKADETETETDKPIPPRPS